MKEEQKIYIKGNLERGSEVIKILTDLGGKNTHSYAGDGFDSYYFIDPCGVILVSDFNSEVFSFVKEFYKEIKVSDRWKTGDILVNNNSSKFYVFDKFTEQGNIFVYLEITKDSREDKTILNITEMYHLISCTSLHKVNDKELKIFYDTLAEKNLSWDTYNKELVRGNYTYFYPKNGHYYFRRNTIRCKDRITGEWYDSVLYSDANEQYVRELNDFNIKFKKV